ncbi:MAG: hypothetical protein ACRYFR_04905 [Janthinobacterium lividum]
MAFSEALVARAQAWADQPLNDKRRPAGLAELAALWSAITGQPAGTCRQCQFSDFNATVGAYLRESFRYLHPELMADAKFLLAAAFATQSLVHESYNKAVTADNLTDEDAAFFITHGYAHAFTKANGKPLSEADIAKITAKQALDDDADEPSGAIQVTPANALVPAADLLAEQTAHAATKEALEAETKAYEQMKVGYNDGTAALESEKTAHAATAKLLEEVQLQLAEATKPKPSKKADTSQATA